MKNKTICITEEAHDSSSDEKLSMYGYGEWVEELDVIQFTYLGYYCMVNRNFEEGGHLGGFIRVPQNHCMYGVCKEHIPIDCHNGLTYCSPCMDSIMRDHIIGFHCGHETDLVPADVYFDRISQLEPPKGFEKHPLYNPVYRNMEYCMAECIHIVDQLISLHLRHMLKYATDPSLHDYESRRCVDKNE